MWNQRCIKDGRWTPGFYLFQETQKNIFLQSCHVDILHGLKSFFSQAYRPSEPMFQRLNQIWCSRLSPSIKGPLAWRWGLHFFFKKSVSLCFFSLLHSTFLPFFFCSQSSVSLDCIWNYRSSYHSLKRLVCPAMCILAVLSNPLVQTLSLSISPTNRSNWYIDCYCCLFVYMQKTVFLSTPPHPTPPSAPSPLWTQYRLQYVLGWKIRLYRSTGNSQWQFNHKNVSVRKRNIYMQK